MMLIFRCRGLSRLVRYAVFVLSDYDVSRVSQRRPVSVLTARIFQQVSIPNMESSRDAGCLRWSSLVYGERSR